MATVEINSGGRYVKVQQDNRDAELLVPVAQKLWNEVEVPDDDKPGGAIGFRDERRWTPEARPTSTWIEPVSAQGGE